MRLPPTKQCLTAVDFDLVPNKPPPQAAPIEDDDQSEDEEEEEDDEEPIDVNEDHDMDMAEGLFGMETDSNVPSASQQADMDQVDENAAASSLVPFEEEEEEDEGGLFGDGDDDDEQMQTMDDIQGDTGLGGLESMANGTKRRLEDEDEDYDA